MSEYQGELLDVEFGQEALIANMRPAMYLSGKISDCSGRKPPALSHRWITGSRFSIAISRQRTIFFTVKGYQAPPLMVESFA